MEEKDIAPMIEIVLERWAKVQTNLGSQCARQLIAADCAKEIAEAMPVAPSYHQRRDAI